MGAARLFLLAFLALETSACRERTFSGTRITALRNVQLDDDAAEVTDYNFFAKAAHPDLIPVHHVTGCISPTTTADGALVDAVAIEIRGAAVPVFYEGAVRDLPLLHSIHVQSCNVTALKARALLNLPALHVVKIQDNDIVRVPEGFFNNLMAKRVVLTFNNIAHIDPGAFDDMPRLESVNLSHNRLGAWKIEWFSNCPRVAVVSAKFNRIREVPARAFRNVQASLERIYLSNNEIRSVHARGFEGLGKLTDLNLSNNNITVLSEETFLYLLKLKLIDLSGTSIDCFSDFLLNTLRPDVLLWIDNVPLNDTCKPGLKEWAEDNENSLTFYRALRTVAATTVRPKYVRRN